ncbi:hypothetical protein [Turicibacter sp.]|uniref:hypothetical protein n=1 Tax=Turicibacter sp. TaxID=2049042 RepID=UPI001B41FE3F|nr:hypothetical protein [Turicibacter sp.]MBP3902863.1 hypothetical protein [Turicibacter sp.]
MEENKKKEATKQIQKNFKFSTEEEKNELTTLLANMELAGSTDGAKILNLVKSLMSTAEYKEVIEGADESLNAIYKAGLTELEILTDSIRDRYRILMNTSNEAFKKSEAKNEKYFGKKIENLEKLIEKKEDDELKLKAEIESLNKLLSDKRRIAGEAVERADELEKQLLDKDKIIEDLRSQISQKDSEVKEVKAEKEQLIIESKEEREDLKKSIVDLNKSQQENLKKVDELRDENDKLKASYAGVNQVNSELTLKLSQKEMEIEFSIKEKARLESDLARIQGDLTRIRAEKDEANAKVEQSLIATRQLEEELRNQMMKVMSDLATQSTPTPVLEEDGGKDSQNTTTTKPKPTVQKTTFQVVDSKGKKLFEGNLSGLVKYVNTVQSEKVTTKTDVNVIEDLLSPCVLKVIKK